MELHIDIDKLILKLIKKGKINKYKTLQENIGVGWGGICDYKEIIKHKRDSLC